MSVPFFLSPAQSITGIIDYSTTEGRKYYERSISKLRDELFDCEDDLHLFIDALKERAEEMGWSIPGVGITDIPLEPLNPDTQYVNILERHGELTLDQVCAFEATYISQNLRAAQDTYAMYRCIMNSISLDMLKKISIWRHHYYVDGKSSGNSLFKVLIRECGLDTKTTTTHIRRCLSKLGAYMKKVDDNVLMYNTHVKGLVRSLNERGEKSQDLLVNVSNGYMACGDRNFKKYITSVLERDEDDPTSNLTADQLMVKAANKYKSYVQDGLWKKPDDIDKEILALKAEVQRTKEAAKSQKTQHDKKKGGYKTPYTKGRYIDQKVWQERPAWLRNHERPRDLSTPKVFDKVTFYWCDRDTKGWCRGRWVKHMPTRCPKSRIQKKGYTSKPGNTGKPAGNVKESRKSDDQTPPDQRTKKARQVAAALEIETPVSDDE